MLATLILGTLLVLTLNVSVKAALLSYVFPSLVNYSSFSGPSINDKLAGTGYVGMRSGHGGISFTESFSLGIDSSLGFEIGRTALEVNV